MKDNCDVIRDLMPLCIDETASEKSRQMVGEHVLECKPCMEVYQEMRTEVNREMPDSDPTKEPFNRTVHKLRHQWQKRRLIAGSIGAVVAILLCLMGGYVYQTLTTDYARNAGDENYSVQLNRRSNGQVIVTLNKLNERQQDMRMSFNTHTGVLTLYAVTSTWPMKTSATHTPYLYDDLYWDNQTQRLMIKCTTAQGEPLSVEVKEVRRGRDFNGIDALKEIVYVQGDIIPLVEASQDASYPIYEVQADDSDAEGVTYVANLYGYDADGWYDDTVYIRRNADGEYEFYSGLETPMPTPTAGQTEQENMAEDAAATETVSPTLMPRATKTVEAQVTSTPATTPTATLTPPPAS